MLRAEVVQAHIPPKPVQDVLGDDSIAGFSQGFNLSYAWALQRQTLLVWKAEDGLNATVRRLPLSEPTSGRVFVEVIPQSNSAAVTVLLCTGSGQFYVWLDANYPVTTYHSVLAVSANSSTAADLVICGLAASPANSGASLGFLAVVATVDGALHLYHGSQNGIFPRQFYKPTGAAAPKAGMLGALGSVVKALYSEAFDPLHNVQRASASAMAALQLQLLQLDSNRWKLLVLTADALDCWLLGTISGHNSTEQLLWSFNMLGVLSESLQAKELALLAFAATTYSISHQMLQPTTGQHQGVQKRQMLYVWSAYLSATSLKHTHVLSCFALEEGNAIPLLLQTTRLDKVPLPEPDNSSRELREWQMVPHSKYSSCLLLSPNGTILEWLGSGADTGTPQTLGTSSGNLAITCTANPDRDSPTAVSNWRLLNAAYGVLEFLAQCPSTDSHPAQQRPVTTWTPEQEAVAIELVNKTVELMYKEYVASCPYTELAEGLSDRLARLGVFASDQGSEALVLASRDIVDKMPKAGSAAFSSGSLMELLSKKGARHDILLAAYKTGGVLEKLPAQEMRTVFEHAEMLASAAAVLDWQRRSEAESGDAASGVTREQTAAAAAVIEAAGLAAAEGIEAGSATGHWEVFFSRPAVSMPALFGAAADEAAGLSHALQAADDDGTAHHALQQLLGLSGLLQAAVLGADNKASQLSASMSEEVRYHRTAGPSWLSSDNVRAAWQHIAEACLLVRRILTDPSERLQLAHAVHLPAIQHLLSGMKDVITRSSTPPAAALKEDYAEVAAQHGASLLNDAAEELDAMRSAGYLATASSAAGDDQSQGPVLNGALVWPLEQLAQQHGAHELLYHACELLLTTGMMDRQRLLGWMQQEVQQNGAALVPDSFTFYVMERWRSTGQLSLLMQLGRQGFQQQLQQFLASYPSLLWMSQVQANMLQQAAATLDKAADTEQASLSNRRRLLCLAKLAAHASGSTPASQQLKAKATTRLRQLSLQQQLQPETDIPLSTAQFAVQALNDQDRMGVDPAEAAVAAVEALALAPEQSQSDQYRQLWNRGWQSVLAHTPLADLTAARAASRDARGQPEQFEDSVRHSPLYMALVRVAAALVDARQAQVQQRTPSAVDCIQHIMEEAVKTVEPLLASA